MDVEREINNVHLKKIHHALSPEPDKGNTSSEFIPHLFYSLHQLKKEPNNSSNSFETATSSIRHRLKLCKSHISESGECKALLSKSCDEWEQVIQQKQKEIEVKRQVLESLGDNIKNLGKQ